MSIFNLAFNTGRLRSLVGDTPDKMTLADRLINLGRELAAGMIDQITLTFDATPLNATGTITLSSSSGVITATTNGVALATASLSGTDTENAAALAVVINASSNALVTGIVTATSALGVVTVTAARKGKAGNAITTAASGTGAIAYSIPAPGESADWGTALNAFLVALGANQATVKVLATGSAAIAPFKMTPQASAPTGPNTVGDMYMTTAGVLKVCTVAGSPGTFVSVGGQT